MEQEENKESPKGQDKKLSHDRHNEEAKDNRANSLNKKTKSEKSTKKHIRYFIFKGIMNYSLLVGFILGLLTILLGIFESSFLALNLFLIMMGAIYSLFNIKSNKRIFQEFMTMIGTIVFVALLLTYISSTSNLIPVSDRVIGNVFRTLQYVLSMFVSLFMVPCIVSAFKLVFLNKKSEE